MRITRRSLVSCLSLSLLLTGCAVEEVGPVADPPAADPPAADPPADPATALAIRIDPAAPSYAAGDTPWIDMTYTNTSTEPVTVLAWTLPSDDLWEDLFAVRVDGERAPYIGRIYRRADPMGDDLVVLPPGQSITGRIDLSRLYDFTRTGTYELEVRADAGALTVDDGAERAHRDARPIVSNTVTLFGEGRPRPSRGDDGTASYYGITYVRCSSSQKTDVRTGMRVADDQAADATSYLANPPSNRARYKRWFGTYSSSRWRTVKNVFDTLRNRLNDSRMRFHCDCTDDYYAYVYPDDPYNIYLCNIYWDASLDDKGGTVIHELTHFYAVGGTDDVTYGASACERLARSNPGQAVRNADNYAYFCELP